MIQGQQKRKRPDAPVDRVRLKATLARLEEVLEALTTSWGVMALLLTKASERIIRIDEERLTVLSARGKVLASAPWLHFNAARIKELLGDLQRTREALDKANRGLHVVSAKSPGAPRPAASIDADYAVTRTHARQRQRY